MIDEFTKCLGVVSHSRAGWDYQLSPNQKAMEYAQEKTALKRAREIWHGNPDAHDGLRQAFKDTGPWLATMHEIERT